MIPLPGSPFRCPCGDLHLAATRRPGRLDEPELITERLCIELLESIVRSIPFTGESHETTESLQRDLDMPACGVCWK